MTGGITMNRWIRLIPAVLAISLAWAFCGNARGNTVEYTVTDLGALGGFRSIATGINDSGQVVGAVYNDDAGILDQTARAFLYSNGTMHDLGSVDGFTVNVPNGINSSGQVVGYAGWPGFYALGSNHAFINSNGVITDLGAGADNATGINDNGQVVGTFIPSSTGSEHAFLYTNGTMTDLGTLGGKSSERMPSTPAARW